MRVEAFEGGLRRAMGDEATGVGRGAGVLNALRVGGVGDMLLVGFFTAGEGFGEAVDMRAG